jgi:hypothetical protein
MSRRITPSSSSPKTPPDTVATAASVSVPRVSSTVNAKIGPLLRDAVTALHDVNGVTNYKATLAALRKTDGAPAYLAQAYHATPAHEYLQRWSVATVLGDLHNPHALAPLHTIAIAPLPQVAGEDAPDILAEETIIRTAAVEGIARQAAQNPDARALLLQSAQSPVFSVRRAAAQAYLAHGGARAELEKVIPPDQRFILDIRSITASDLPPTKAPQTAPRDPSRAVLAPGTPGAPAQVAAPDGPRSK